MNAKKSSRLGIAGLVLKGVSMLSPNNVSAQEIEKVNIQSEYASPQVIATFQYKSNRPEPEYNGKTFTYNLLSNGTVSQVNPKVEGVEFSQRWFYDINSDENFGQAELDAMKNKTLIYMHPEFNDIVNNLIAEKLKSGEHSQKVIDNYRKLCAELYGKISKREPETESKKNLVSFIAGARAGIPGFLGSNGLYGGELGIKYGRFALMGNVNTRPDRNITNTEEQLMNDVYLQTREDLKDFHSLGASLEYHQPILPWLSAVLGAGANIENYTREGKTSLVKKTNQGESVINSNTQSFSEKEFVGNVYAGPSFKITNWLRLNPNIGYEAAFKDKGLKGKGAYANLRAIISVPNKYKGNR